MRSPLIYGGAVTGAGAVPPEVYSIVTNQEMLRITDDIVAPAEVDPVQRGECIDGLGR